MLHQANFLSDFQCLGDQCEDTCCKGWGMQVDIATFEKYQKEAPELVDAVTSGEAEHIMRRDPETDYCIKFDAGLCSVHRDKGTEFLGDACHFFPRITRQLGDINLQTASLSCPEVARLTLLKEQPHHITQQEDQRLPYSLKDYLPEGMNSEQALQTHQHFLDAAEDDAVSAEHIICRLHSVASSMEALDKKTCAEAVPFYLKMADGRLADAEHNAADPFNLFHALAGLLSATRKSNRPRLEAVIDSMAALLHAEIDANNQLHLQDDSLQNYQQAHTAWQETHQKLQPIFKRWLQTQLSAALFPFAGFGEKLSDKMVFIAVRFATVKLGLMAHHHTASALTDEDIVRITQSLARFMDHLGDPTLSLQIYHETGWTKAPRLRGLLES